MLKIKALILGLTVVVASLLPAPSAQASELVKLGKLLVTGKRAPSAVADTKPAAAAGHRDGASERFVPRTEAIGERGGAAVAPRVSPEAVSDAPSVDWGERQPVESNPRVAPGGGAAGDRIGRSPPPGNGLAPLA